MKATPEGWRSELPDMDVTAHEMLQHLVHKYHETEDPETGSEAQKHVLHLTIRELYFTAEFLIHHQDSEQGEEYWTEYQQDIEDLLCVCGGLGFHTHHALCAAAEVLQ